MERGLYLAAFANAGMEPEMQLGLYLAAFANAGMEPEMVLAVFANEGMDRKCSSGCIWLYLQM